MKKFSDTISREEMKAKMYNLNSITESLRSKIDEVFLNESEINEKMTDLVYIMSELLAPYLYTLSSITKQKEIPQIFLDITLRQTLEAIEKCKDKVSYSCESVD